MPNCKICGKPAESGNVVHAECWDEFRRELRDAVCLECCKYPRLVDSAEELEEKYCGRCQVLRKLGYL